MDVETKIEKRLAVLKNKQEKEEAIIATHNNNLEKIKNDIAECESKKDAQLIKDLLVVIKKEHIRFTKENIAEFVAVAKKDDVSKADDVADIEKVDAAENAVDEKATEEKNDDTETFIPKVSDVFR